jgi:hypothetical protein
MTTIVNKHTDPYDEYIGRGSQFGNEFVIGRDGTRIEVIEKYKEGFRKRILEDIEFRCEVLKLKNKILGCYCKTKQEPDRPCHGDVIKEYLTKRIGLAIVGSRNFDNFTALYALWNKYFKNNFDYIVSGGANGVDTCSRQLAGEIGIDHIEFLPDWDKWGKSAGFKRNKDIINNCNAMLAIWRGSSPGTGHSIELAKQQKKPSFIFYV